MEATDLQSFIFETGYSRDKSTVQTGKNLPELINVVVWVRQLIARVADTNTTAVNILGDLQGFQVNSNSSLFII